MQQSEWGRASFNDNSPTLFSLTDASRDAAPRARGGDALQDDTRGRSADHVDARLAGPVVADEGGLDVAEPPGAHDAVRERDRVGRQAGAALAQRPHLGVRGPVLLGLFAVADVGVVAVGVAVAVDVEARGGE